MSEVPLHRRRVLRGVVGGLAAGAGISWLLPAATESPLQAEDNRSETEEDTDPLDEGETPYAVYQYEPVERGREFAPTSPINVVFPLEEATFKEVIDVFREAGWYTRPSEYARYAYDRDADTWTRSHWSGAETVFGLAPRLHVRCWELAGTASIQAHIDTPATPRHQIHSYAGAVEAVMALFRNAEWDVDPSRPDTIDLRNAQPPDHDGRAVVIRR